MVAKPLLWVLLSNLVLATTCQLFAVEEGEGFTAVVTVSPTQAVFAATARAAETRAACGSLPEAPELGDAHVEDVRAVQQLDETWTFHVTIKHQDTGPRDYVNGWDVVIPDGTILLVEPSACFTRPIDQPHEGYLSFVDSQVNIVIPDGVTQVFVRAHDQPGGFGGEEIWVDLTVDSGPGFEVERP
jgi:hypothetical protein